MCISCILNLHVHVHDRQIRKKRLFALKINRAKLESWVIKKKKIRIINKFKEYVTMSSSSIYSMHDEVFGVEDDNDERIPLII